MPLTPKDAAVKLLLRLLQMTGYPETPEQEAELKEVLEPIDLKGMVRDQHMRELKAQLNKFHLASPLHFKKKG